ncbi:MAG: glycosyltransferase family 2 protein [Candidatus Aminicenantes bacterium]|nr:glycosyltransferase family 2 protein [Candidatus Aminicenantes bacterium]
MAERIDLIMPAYNAGRTVEAVFSRVPAAARGRLRREVVVDDGSMDDTPAALDRLRPAWPNLVVLRHRRNLGYGAAEKTLLRAARDGGADAVVLLHADGQYAPERIPALLDALETDRADLVQGSRLLGGGALRGGMPLYKYVSNRALTAVENAAFGLRLAEYHSGFLVYGRRMLNAVPFEALSDSFAFDLEMIVMARVLGFVIREVAIPTRYADEVSHLKPVRYGLDVLRVVRGFRRGRYHRLLEREHLPAAEKPA